MLAELPNPARSVSIMFGYSRHLFSACTALIAAANLLAVTPPSQPAVSDHPPVKSAQVIRVTMKPREFKNLNSPLAIDAQRMNTEIPAASLKLPAGVRGEPKCFGLAVGSDRYHVLCGQTPPRLYIDLDGNGGFENRADIQLKAFRRAPGTVLFDPVRLDRGDEQPSTQVVFQVSEGTLWSMPAEYREGEAVIRGRKCLFALVDRNLDGAYDHGCTVPPDPQDARNWDGLAADLNHNGRFDEPVNAGRWESQPLTSSIILDNRRYSLKAKTDGSAIELQELELRTGDLEVTSELDLLVLLGESGFVRLDTGRRNRRWTLPAGKYICWAGSIAIKDGDIWTLWSDPDKASKILFEIKPGEVLQVPLGRRLKLVRLNDPATAGRTGDPPGRITFGSVLSDDTGMRYTAVLCNGLDRARWEQAQIAVAAMETSRAIANMFGQPSTPARPAGVATAGPQPVSPTFRTGFG